MPRKPDDDLEVRLWAVPVPDRIAMLIGSIVEQDPNALSVSSGMLGCLVEMSRGLGQENRARLCALLRDASEHLEGCTRPTGDDRRAMH
jgi:hypothetical protein